MEGVKRGREGDEEDDSKAVGAAAAGDDDEEDDFGPMPASKESERKAARAARKRAKRMQREEAKKRAAEEEQRALERAMSRVPRAARYERSFMHRSRLTHVRVVQSRSSAVAASTTSRSFSEAAAEGATFIVTASDDGHVKFWRKNPRGIEFVKHFIAHPPGYAITGMSVSADASTLATCAAKDGSVKLFDVAGWDMTSMLSVLPVHPIACALLQKDGRYLALAGQDRQEIFIYDLQHVQVAEVPGVTSGKQAQPIATLSTVHRAPVLHIAYNNAAGMCISADASGVIAYWNAEPPFSPFEPAAKLRFTFAVETHLYALAAKKVIPLSLEISPDGKQFSVVGSDGIIRVFAFASGKIIREFNESLSHQESLAAEANAAVAEEKANKAKQQDDDNKKEEGPKDEQKDDGTGNVETKNSNPYALERMDLGRRAAAEKEISDNQTSAKFAEALKHTVSEGEEDDGANAAAVAATMLPITARWNAIFDETGDLLIYATMFGIKVVQIASGRVLRLLGNTESTTRFMQLSLFQQSVESAPGKKEIGDPTLFCTAWKQQRFYLFSNREPIEESSDSSAPGRDVLNERVSAVDAAKAQKVNALTSTRLAKSATIHTSYGDIYIRLFPDECPRTVENFTVHSQNGYYNGVLFHRVIKGFMIQTGDPKGDGTGGESIWGGDFEDEFSKNLKHDRPFTVSMANAGPNTNGSQFFITTAPVPRLDGKHTVFGRVYKGEDVVTKIEDAKVRKFNSRPYEDIRILSIDTSLEAPPP